MRRIITFYCFFFLPWISYAQTNQTGTGLDCNNAFYTTDNLFCSDNAHYNNSNIAQNGITWFKFKAILPVVTATISGDGPGGSLTNPTATIYSDCGNTQISFISSNTSSIRTIHAEGLSQDAYYYIAVTGSNKGTFKLCINNYEPVGLNGPDCDAAGFIYNTNDIKVAAANGIGNNGREADGTCMEGLETNSTWFKWQAANNDALVFTITPDMQTNDINFVLYDLGLSGSCGDINGANAKRCAAGSGVSCKPPLPRYYQTGLSASSTDQNENPGCALGLDGMVQSLNMIAGHYYALLVDNLSSNRGFTIKFSDPVSGAPSTVKFSGPKVDINITPNSCQADRTYIFYSYLTVTNPFKWDFGPGATILNADALDKFTVIYDTPGKSTLS